MTLGPYWSIINTTIFYSDEHNGLLCLLIQLFFKILNKSTKLFNELPKCAVKIKYQLNNQLIFINIIWYIFNTNTPKYGIGIEFSLTKTNQWMMASTHAWIAPFSWFSVHIEESMMFVCFRPTSYKLTHPRTGFWVKYLDPIHV